MTSRRYLILLFFTYFLFQSTAKQGTTSMRQQLQDVAYADPERGSGGQDPPPLGFGKKNIFNMHKAVYMFVLLTSY